MIRPVRLVIVACLGIVAIGLIGYGAYSARVSACPVISPLRILAVGDSITAGTFGNNYRDPLWQRFRDVGIRAIFVGPIEEEGRNPATKAHLGLADRRVADLLPRIREVTTQFQPDVVLVMMGTNDAQRYDIDPAPKQMEEVINRIFAGRSKAMIFVGAVPPTDRDLMDKLLKIYNGAVKEIVDAKNKSGVSVYFVDNYAVLGVTDLYDGIHPSMQGYGKLADSWYNAICTVGKELRRQR
jgi:lysophospholipase L1-like esterase